MTSSAGSSRGATVAATREPRRSGPARTGTRRGARDRREERSIAEGLRARRAPARRSASAAARSPARSLDPGPVHAHTGRADVPFPQIGRSRMPNAYSSRASSKSPCIASRRPTCVAARRLEADRVSGSAWSARTRSIASARGVGPKTYADRTHQRRSSCAGTCRPAEVLEAPLARSARLRGVQADPFVARQAPPVDARPSSSSAASRTRCAASSRARALLTRDRAAHAKKSMVFSTIVAIAAVTRIAALRGHAARAVCALGEIPASQSASARSGASARALRRPRGGSRSHAGTANAPR